MSTLAIVLIAIALLLVVALLLAALKPNTFVIVRSTAVDRTADRVFPLINDLRAQTTWSPFEKDPNIKRVHSGAAQGQGAVYEWSGNRDVGAGRNRHRRLDALPHYHGPADVAAVRMPQCGRVRPGTQREWHRCHLGHARGAAVFLQSGLSFF